MKLFKILLTHAAPKDHETAIKEYVIAESHGDVFSYLYDKTDYTWWNEKEWTEDEMTTVLFGHGEGALENDWADAYYGVTEYDWEQVKETLTEVEIEALQSTGVAKII